VLVAARGAECPAAGAGGDFAAFEVSLHLSSRTGAALLDVSVGLRAACREDGGDAEVDRRDAGESPCLLPFLPQEGEGEVDALDFAEPPLGFGSGPAARRSASISSRRGSIFGLMLIMGHLRQACSCWQGVA
jgi:hypothetical protein